MAFSKTNSKGVTYFLHKKDRVVASGKISSIYYFAKEVNDERSLETLPAGYQVSETKNGLPVLKKVS